MRTIKTITKLQLRKDDALVAKKVAKIGVLGGVAILGSKTVGTIILGYGAAKLTGHIIERFTENKSFKDEHNNPIKVIVVDDK